MAKSSDLLLKILMEMKFELENSKLMEKEKEIVACLKLINLIVQTIKMMHVSSFKQLEINKIQQRSCKQQILPTENVITEEAVFPRPKVLLVAQFATTPTKRGVVLPSFAAIVTTKVSVTEVSSGSTDTTIPPLMFKHRESNPRTGTLNPTIKKVCGASRVSSETIISIVGIGCDVSASKSSNHGVQIRIISS
jgi:hypothetical protein